MKNILCFGDSNTWGYTPITGERYPFSVRWTGVLQQSLGDDFRVIEEGLNGRTTSIDEPGRANRSGIALLPVLLESHRPLDLVVIMLGTNDLKAAYGQSARDIAKRVGEVCQAVLDNDYLEGGTEVLLVCPTWIVAMSSEDDAVFARAQEKSRMLVGCYQSVAKELAVHFINAAKIVQTTTSDGIHWEADQHSDFGKAIAQQIKAIIK